MALFVAAFSMMPATAQTFSENGINYIIEGDAATVIESPNARGKVVVPDEVTYNGRKYPVTALGERAFADIKSGIREVYVGNNVVNIGKHAFIHCESMHTLVLGKSVARLGVGCLGFTGSLDMVACSAPVPPVVGKDVWWQCSAQFLMVPEQSQQLYVDSIGWKRFRNKTMPMT